MEMNLNPFNLNILPKKLGLVILLQRDIQLSVIWKMLAVTVNALLAKSCLLGIL